MQSTLYSKLREYVGKDCNIDIPIQWDAIVVECIECIHGICDDDVTFIDIRNKNGELFVEYDLNDWTGLKAYIDDEIHFANLDIQKLEGVGDNMLYGADEQRCSVCNILTSKYTARKINGKTYCKNCGVKIAAPKLLVIKRADGRYVIDGKEQLKPVNVEVLINRCDWFLRRHIKYNDGAEKMYLEYFGTKVCRYFEHNKEIGIPASWGYCLTRGICPFV